MELKIGRDTLLAISAVAWADGSMDAREAEALRQAAKQRGIAGDDLSQVERALTTRVSLDEVETAR